MAGAYRLMQICMGDTATRTTSFAGTCTINRVSGGTSCKALLPMTAWAVRNPPQCTSLTLRLMVFSSALEASTAEESQIKHGTCDRGCRTLTLLAAVPFAAVHTEQGASSNYAKQVRGLSGLASEAGWALTRCDGILLYS